MTAKQLRENGVSFFLGAGASMEMGFPSGAKLRQRITNDLSNPEKSDLGRQMLRTLPHNKTDLRQFADDLSRSENTTVDEFLHRNSANDKYMQIGRLAVWLTILEAEQRAQYLDIREFWLYHFLDRYLEGIRHPDDLYYDFSEGNGCVFLHGLLIHTLNYDRLAEHAILSWIKHKFPKLDLNQSNYIENLNPNGCVRHNHGNLGALLKEEILPFGSKAPEDPELLLKRSEALKFWFEPSNARVNWARTNRLLELRGVHIITGFGYHEMIRNRFGKPDSIDANIKRVVATSDTNCRPRADKWLRTTYSSPRIQIDHLKDGSRCCDITPFVFS